MAHVSAKPGADTAFYESGSPAVTADLIDAQDRARSNPATVAKNWTPWIIGGVLLGGVLYFTLRD